MKQKIRLGDSYALSYRLSAYWRNQLSEIFRKHKRKPSSRRRFHTKPREGDPSPKVHKRVSFAYNCLSKASRNLRFHRLLRKSMTQQVSCVQTPAKAPALPGLGLAMGIVVLLVTMSICGYAQEGFTVTGKVISAASSQPIEGATITNKRTQIHAATDRLGEYRIPARPDDILIFSFVGYQTLEESVNGREKITVVLDSLESILDEVEINAGYYTTTDKYRTGNIGRVDEKVISRQPVGNPMLALQGRVPGLEISQVNGVPGSNVRIMIRGQNSISNGNEPLYIVDGVPWLSTSVTQVAGAGGSQSPFNSINPADISSIEVLKDADATAIYGSRGSNGVILISTKRGGADRQSIDVNYHSGFGRITRMMELMDTQDYVLMRREALQNQGVEPTTANAPDLILHDTSRYTNWINKLVGNPAKLTNVQLGFNGGNNQTNFRLGGGFRKESTVFPGDLANSRGSVQLNLGHRSTSERLHINITGTFSSDLKNMIPSDVTGQIYAQPNLALVNTDGSLAWSENGSPNYNNPLGALLQTYRSKVNTLITNVTANYQMIEGLDLKINAGYTNLTLDEKAIFPKNSYQPLATRISGNSRFGNRGVYSWVLEPQIVFNKRWHSHEFAVLVGASWQEEENGGKIIQASNFSSEALLHTPTGAATLTTTESYYKYRYQSVFGRVNYHYQRQYLVNATVRRDGSSRFGPNRKYADFGALGVAWLFSEIAAVKEHVSVLSLGKLRASYGITGNDKIGDYQYMDSYGSVRYPYEGEIGLSPQRLFNPEYGWETNKKLEGALELGFWEDRLRFSGSWFRNRSGNQLMNYSLPSQTGFTGIARNLPALVENKGWEFELNGMPWRSTKWAWQSSFNLTSMANKLLEFPGLEASSYASRFELGESLNIVKVYKYLGVDPTSGIWQVDTDAGLSTVMDLTPNYYGGWDNTISYSGLQLNFFFQFVKKIAPNYIHTLPSPAGIRGFNQPKALLDRWQVHGDLTDIQRFSPTGEEVLAWSLYYTNSTGAYTDASFLRLKNVELAYKFPSFHLGTASIHNLRVYSQAQNLFTFTRYMGNDPEVTTMVALPPIKMFAFGLQLTI